MRDAIEKSPGDGQVVAARNDAGLTIDTAHWPSPAERQLPGRPLQESATIRAASRVLIRRRGGAGSFPWRAASSLRSFSSWCHGSRIDRSPVGSGSLHRSPGRLGRPLPGWCYPRTIPRRALASQQVRSNFALLSKNSWRPGRRPQLCTHSCRPRRPGPSRHCGRKRPRRPPRRRRPQQRDRS